MNNNKNESRRYIAKIKGIETKNNGTMYKILVDNPYATDAQGNPNKHWKGTLLWVEPDGSTYPVKAIALKGVSEKAASNGYINSLCIDLDSEYDVIKNK